MKMLHKYHADTLTEWQTWLQKHHSSESEVWLVFYKKDTGKPNVSYADAVDEALCYGWIDSLIQKIDNETYARKFTPRKISSKWSALNKRRVTTLIKKGRMTEAGKATITFIDKEDDYGRTPKQKSLQLNPPPFLQQALMKNRKVWENFQQLAPSYRRNYITWISSAKTNETRSKRLKEAITLLSQNKKLGMK
jgi:uncharacterized protein YdeI (YjbR/CyaY-like superfamily)